MSDPKTPAISDDTTVNDLITDATKKNKMSLEALVLLVNMERLKYLQTKTNSEFKELKTRQEDVSKLQKLLKKINTLVTNAGDLDLSSNPEMQQLLKEAKEMGVDMKENQFKFNKNEKDALVENIRMTIDDKNVKNDMQLQTVNRLTNERYEAYQMARSILKPLHEAKMKVTQGVRS